MSLRTSYQRLPRAVALLIVTPVALVASGVFAYVAVFVGWKILSAALGMARVFDVGLPGGRTGEGTLIATMLACFALIAFVFIVSWFMSLHHAITRRTPAYTLAGYFAFCFWLAYALVGGLSDYLSYIGWAWIAIPMSAVIALFASDRFVRKRSDCKARTMAADN